MWLAGVDILPFLLARANARDSLPRLKNPPAPDDAANTGRVAPNRHVTVGACLGRDNPALCAKKPVKIRADFAPGPFPGTRFLGGHQTCHHRRHVNVGKTSTNIGRGIPLHSGPRPPRSGVNVVKPQPGGGIPRDELFDQRSPNPSNDVKSMLAQRVRIKGVDSHFIVDPAPRVRPRRTSHLTVGLPERDHFTNTKPSLTQIRRVWTRTHMKLSQEKRGISYPTQGIRNRTVVLRVRSNQIAHASCCAGMHTTNRCQDMGCLHPALREATLPTIWYPKDHGVTKISQMQNFIILHERQGFDLERGGGAGSPQKVSLQIGCLSPNVAINTPPSNSKIEGDRPNAMSVIVQRRGDQNHEGNICVLHIILTVELPINRNASIAPSSWGKDPTVQVDEGTYRSSQLSTQNSSEITAHASTVYKPCLSYFLRIRVYKIMQYYCYNHSHNAVQGPVCPPNTGEFGKNLNGTSAGPSDSWRGRKAESGRKWMESDTRGQTTTPSIGAKNCELRWWELAPRYNHCIRGARCTPDTPGSNRQKESTWGDAGAYAAHSSREGVGIPISSARGKPALVEEINNTPARKKGTFLDTAARPTTSQKGRLREAAWKRISFTSRRNNCLKPGLLLLSTQSMSWIGPSTHRSSTHGRPRTCRRKKCCEPPDSQRREGWRSCLTVGLTIEIVVIGHRHSPLEARRLPRRGTHSGDTQLNACNHEHMPMLTGIHLPPLSLLWSGATKPPHQNHNGGLSAIGHNE